MLAISWFFCDFRNKLLHLWYRQQPIEQGCDEQTQYNTMKHNTQNYVVPSVKACDIVAERGYSASMLEDPFEQPEQNW